MPRSVANEVDTIHYCPARRQVRCGPIRQPLPMAAIRVANPDILLSLRLAVSRLGRLHDARESQPLPVGAPCWAHQRCIRAHGELGRLARFAVLQLACPEAEPARPTGARLLKSDDVAVFVGGPDGEQPRPDFLVL